MHFTEESIHQLAPDAASAKAGQQLASPVKWLNAHIHPEALWGECKGSGSNPYFTQIDLNNLAFKCSCPSRKFPCKHGLALLWLSVKHPGFFIDESELSPRVAEWLTKRQDRADAKATKASKPVAEDEQLKRNMQREQKVEQGLEELERWMKDIIRTGIKNMPGQQYTAFRHIVARMVDAQAGGLANQLRELSEINYFGTGWEIEFMRQFSKMYILMEAYRNRSALSEAWKQELRLRIGWNTTKEELSTVAANESYWSVMRVERTPFDKLISEKTWFFNTDSFEIAYQLQFYMPQQAATAQLYTVGTLLKAKTVFYPGQASQRIWIKEARIMPDKYTPTTSSTHMETVMKQIADICMTNPFQDEIPFLMADVRVVRSGAKWFLIDADNAGLPIEQNEKEILKIWALTASQPMTAFILYRQGTFRIMRVLASQV